MTAASVAAVIRSSDDSPEPSTSRTPAVGMRGRAHLGDAPRARPAALVPTPPSSVPRCLRSISAVKLSLSWFISRHDRRERIRACPRRAGRRRRARSRARCARRRRSCARRAPCGARAPRGAAARAPASRARGRPRAQRAAASRRRRSTASSRAPPRRVSNADSSPRIRPVTRRIPLARSVAASRRCRAEVSVGSPLPRRYRSPCQTRPGPPADPEHLRREAVLRAEPRQRGPRDGKLLVRRRMDRERVALCA